MKNYSLFLPYIYNGVFLLSRSPISNFQELEGRNIYIAYKGGSPELMFNKMVNVTNLNIKKININFLHPIMLMKLLLTKKADIIVVPEFFVTQVLDSSKEKIYTYSLEKIIAKNSADYGINRIPVGVVLLNKKLIKTRKIIVDNFLNDLKQTIKFINNSTKKFAKAVANKYKNEYKIKIEESDLIKSILSRRLIFNINYPATSELLKLADFFGFNKDKYFDFIFKYQ